MDFVPFKQVIGPLSAALGLSIGVERTLEFFKNVLESWVGSEHARELPDVAEIGKKTKDLETTLQAAADGDKKEWGESVPQEIALVESATDPDDGDKLRVLVLQLLGCAIGILLARLFDVQLFNAFLLRVNEAGVPTGVTFKPALDFVLTGVLIGGGSGPIHVLIRFVTERKVTAEESRPEEAAASPAPSGADAASKAVVAAPAVVVSVADPAASEWPEFAYDGGVDREILENVHRRSADPNLVVYHHTTMRMSSTFEDVVNVIKNRTDSQGNKWLTGYHCVVLGDGSIHPFCRWDRYGSHAAGYNDRSLGLAFNGNFESDPKVPFSNPTGRFGPLRPTAAQLEAGAKVVALWTFLYPEIPFDFTRGIVPHKDVPKANKPCPGSQFPYEEFRELIAHYRTRWSSSRFAKERIEQFRLKPFIYCAPGRTVPVATAQPPVRAPVVHA